MTEGEEKRAAAVAAAEAAAEFWHRASAGRWNTINVRALTEVLIWMGSVGPAAPGASLEPSWKRRGTASYAGTLWLFSELIWTCAHVHGGRQEAMACAIIAARERQEEAAS